VPLLSGARDYRVRDDLPPAVLEQLRRERRLPYSMGWPIFSGAGIGLLMRFAFFGDAGEMMSAMLSAFIVGAPIVIGVVTVYLAELEERRTWTYYFVSPVVATALVVISSLAIHIEGLICAIIIVPLFAVLGGVAGLAMGAICRATNWPRPTIVSCVAVLPLLFGSFENRISRDHFERVQDREIFIDATPSAVWNELVDTRDIRRDEVDAAWMYRIGVPVPSAGAGEMRDGEHLRHITMGKGIRFDQVATEWLPDERVSWRYRFAPDSFPAGALDDHVRIGGEYFDVGDTTYSLRPDGDGTRLSVRMRYRVSTHFNWYAGPVADFLVGDFAESILDFYARRALSPQAPASS
jgi:hypothetical protein